MEFTHHFYIEGQRIVSLPAEALTKEGKIGEPAERRSPREHLRNRQLGEQFQHIFPTDTVLPEATVLTGN